MVIQFIDYHQNIDVAEWNETERKDTQSIVSLCYIGWIVGTKKVGNQVWVYPDDYTHDNHRHRDEAERFPDNQP